MVSPRIAAVGYAVPPLAMDQQELWDGYFATVYGDDPRAERMWRSAGVVTRYAVVDPRVEDVASWSTGMRMRRFATEAPPLAKQAVSSALTSAGLHPADIGALAVVSCTGYPTPGLDIVLARDLGMSHAVRRLMIGHMGCYAALPGLGAVADYVAVHGRAGVLLCCELTSLHLQPPLPRQQSRHRDDEMEQLVTHALFGDAAAAVVVVPDTGPSLEGSRVVDLESGTDLATSDYMTWQITDHGFRMGLSALVPDVVARHVRPVVRALLGRHGMTIDDVTGWAVHPGGPRILQAVREGLGLTADSLAASYAVLRDHGNCSSPTVLMVLRRLLEEGRGRAIVMLAFGPGLTLYAGLLVQAQPGGASRT
ncbi:MAG TPA: type III polyketide synthase [Actinopolymorphaceae bacterium]